ncbi:MULTISPECIES: HAMP domain-containing sensor histidine kinase [unclassified Streptomyces]|uniref:sensor histidine kinase n=1 Tax=unclassified Streptomyces TaxID=2593676 RepID=UPI002948C3F2|nr:MULTISPECIES: HAMP domain-containing sensor histidine kinase [unclassified Streptomyces]
MLFRERLTGTTVLVLPKDAPYTGNPPTLTKSQVAALADRLRADALDQLLLMSLLALLVMLVASVALGWLVAGRALRPLHTIAATAQRLSAANLHERIGLTGPEDELKNLADTFDALLDRLHAAFEAQRRFVANASHELRTPLAVQRAAIQIRLGRARPEDLPRIQEELLATNRRSERLIQGLLTLATSDRGLDRREPVDLARIAAEAVGQNRPAIHAAGLRLDLDLRPAPVRGDPVLLHQLVVNLVQNAARYNVPDGVIEVAVAGPPGGRGGGVLVVRNTGAPVPPEETDGLLEPFRRLSRSGDGAGLGLSIVRSIAQAHGGTVTLTAPPDGGLWVRIEVPS